ncbi:SDR family oxidoreductase [Amycolatopsis sp. NPDC005232]|uniref:SDR family oxidoreductase n=1 Tax=Amycolatopsis sp. NPDC005232 TaxID=3157027 RepID=UPI0033B67251
METDTAERGLNQTDSTPDGKGQRWIHVNCVAPGVIRTARVVAQSSRTGIVSDAAAATIPLGRQGEAADVADAVEFLLSPMASYVTGQTPAVNGGAVIH